MKNRHLRVLILLILLFAISDCAISTSSNFGRLLPSSQVNYQFQDLQILPDHNYYYSGEILEPDAIMAIHQDYILEKGFWTEVQLTEKQLKDWMWTFSIVEDTYNDKDDWMIIDYEGYVIVSPDGNPVGVYYSKYHHTVVRFLGDNRIEVYKPAPSFTNAIHSI